jgi:hypothetical protein
MGAWLTVEEARGRLEEIRQSAGDDERAHGMEDALRRDVLATVDELIDIARGTETIDFARWCG